MQLFSSPTSPYARKVRMVALEKGLADRIEIVNLNPFDDDPALLACNPLAKVPAMKLDDGQTLADNRVICWYLDSLVDTPMIYPPGPEGWRVLSLEAMADGMMDAAFAMAIEGRRPPDRQSPEAQTRRRDAILRAAERLEGHVDALAGPLTIAQIAVAAALGYLDFRLPDLAWRDNRPTLAGWHADLADRAAYRDTDPTLTAAQ